MARQVRASAQQLLRQKLSELRAAEGAQASAAHAEEAQEFYSYYAYGLPWVQNGKPSVQARQIIQELKSADKKGLLAQDYDGPCGMCGWQDWRAGRLLQRMRWLPLMLS